VYRLATLNPLWTFRVRDVNTNFQGVKVAMGFDVLDQGERLGTIARTYRGNTNVIGISNDRIAKGRSRGDTYHTADAEKAILKAKKLFFRLKPDERIAQATKSAHEAIHSQMWTRERIKAQEENTIRKAAMEYFSGPGLAYILEYIGTQPTSVSTPIFKAVEKAEEVRVEMLTIETIRQRFAKEETALVIKDSGKYLVKVRDNVQLYDDNTLHRRVS